MIRVPVAAGHERPDVVGILYEKLPAAQTAPDSAFGHDANHMKSMKSL